LAGWRRFLLAHLRLFHALLSRDECFIPSIYFALGLLSLSIQCASNPLTEKVNSMQTFRRNLVDISVLGGIVLALALSWGNPFADSANAQDQTQPQQQQRDQRSATFSGKIMRNGELYVLRESSGRVLTLDDAQRARPYVGRMVKVTGRLDGQAKVIHVDNIEVAQG
jgi:hypothetical protein